MYLGRIITNSKKMEPMDFLEKTSDVTKIEGDIPTLIVGKTLAESIYGKDKVKILDRHLSKNVLWTYSKTEKRSAFEEDIDTFNNYAIERMLKDTKYQFFSLFRNNLSRKKGLINFLDNRNVKKVVYVRKNHIYIYYGGELVIGLSLSEAEYLGINPKKCIKRMMKNPNNKIIYNDRFLSFDILGKIGSAYHVIPYLYAIKSGLFY